MSSKRHLQEQKSKDGEELLFHGGKIMINRGNRRRRNILKINHLDSEILQRGTELIRNSVVVVSSQQRTACSKLMLSASTALYAKKLLVHVFVCAPEMTGRFLLHGTGCC